jgi:two-component system CheB/CheR fusion protein
MRKKTDRTTAEPLADAPQLCAYFCEGSPQAMVTVEGKSCVVRQANAAFLKLANASRIDLIGHPFATVIPEPEDNGCESLLDRVFSTGTAETLIEQKHGKSIGAAAVYWSYASWAIPGVDKRPAGVVVQISDSTESAVFRKQSVQMNEALVLSGIRQNELAESADAVNFQLQAALKDKEYIIAVLSHELRTPLAPVLIAASMMQQDDRLAADTRATMEMIHRNITLEANLIDDLLDITRIENVKLNLKLDRIDLRTVLDHSIEVIGDEIETNQMVLETDLGDAPCFVSADEGRLQQVFSNLLKNAVKFTPAGGTISVRCGVDGGSCVASVTDSGSGIEPEFLPRVFTAFEQRDKPHSRKGGLGLGLAICKMIVTLHGGTITAGSAGPARGATFEVRLPAMAAASPGKIPNAPLAPGKAAAAKGLRILLVEDHVDTARMMSRVLKVDGHAVQWACDVAQGLKLAADQEFDLLLSDVGLPDGTGWDLMRALRQAGSAIPGIAMTGYGQDQDVERSHEVGFMTHLTKPLSIQVLRDAIDAIAV